MSQVEEAIKKITEVLSQLSQREQNNSADCRGIQLAPFDESNESFDSYIERVENYLEIRNLNDSTDSNERKRVQIFLNCLGPKFYHTLACLTAPESPKEKKFRDLVNILRIHVCPRASEVAEQHKFALRMQHEGESIGDFQADLQRIASKCNFVCTHCKKSTIETHLRSQFVRGIRDNDIRERLLQEDAGVSFEKIVKLALAIQAAKSESREIRGQVHSSVHAVGLSKGNQKTENTKNITNSKDNDRLKINFGKCFRCGKPNHKASECRSKNLKCNRCKRSGHVSKVCFRKVQKSKAKFEQNQIQREDEDKEDYLYIDTMVACNLLDSKKILKTLKIEGTDCIMEYDTGAAVSTMSEKTFKKLLPHKVLHPTTVKLKTYTGEVIDPKGVCTVEVLSKKKKIMADLYVLRQEVSSILGRDWIKRLNLNTVPINKLDKGDISELECRKRIKDLIQSHANLFVQEVGKIPNYKYDITLQDRKCQQIFFKPRPIPYALKSKVEEEIERLTAADIIEKVPHSPWGTPIVPVVKKDGSLRLCADYKATINKYIKDDKYPIPRIEDIFAKMGGGKYFCVLDLHQAYLHMEVSEESSLLQAISTHQGTYKVKRLMFGVKVSPNAWQRYMDHVLQDLPGVTCFIDDILIQGATYVELIKNLQATFRRLSENDLHINKEKCQFILNKITYLGHIIDEEGIKPMPDKIQAIVKAKRPTNLSELRTFLGLVNYYQRFIPNLSSKLAPLNKLLRKDIPFIWNNHCQQAYEKLKREITSPKTLIKYNPNLPLTLSTDASPTGLGAVISHITEDGEERPIAFASRSLTKAEANYSQLDKEATAIYWGLKKFFQFCYGRKIILITDHKSLTRILHPNKDLPASSALRILHYASFVRF